MGTTLSTDAVELLPDLPATALIGGEWVTARTGDTYDVDNPADGERLATITSCGSEDAVRALDAASAAAAQWAATSPRERSVLLEAAFDLVIARREAFAELITQEMGKPLEQARQEVDYGAEFLRWFSQEAVRGRGRTFVTPAGRTAMVTHDPVGPCYLITPWNFPLSMGTRKIGAALAAGCTVVVKPASATPLTTVALAKVFDEVGLPGGVLNVVTSRHAAEVSRGMFQDTRLAKVSFTGSTQVGSQILRDAAAHVLRSSMELGGNAPFLVFPDADLDAAVAGAMLAKFRNMGQACTAANRFLVHRDIADEFVSRVTAAVEHLTVGDGMDEGVDVGPLIDTGAVVRMGELVADARSKGATVTAGGTASPRSDRFFLPTVLDNVTLDARVIREEIFGPILPVVRFGTEEEALALANDTEYGLAAYAFTGSLATAQRVQAGLHVGMLALNAGVVSEPTAPFGGVQQSGLGREGGSEGIMEYLTTKYTLLG